MADSPSIVIGLRVIRRARIRAWFLAIGLLPVCILTSVLLPPRWISVLPLDGRWVTGGAKTTDGSARSAIPSAKK